MKCDGSLQFGGHSGEWAYLESDPCSVSMQAICPWGPASARAKVSMVYDLPAPETPIRATRALAPALPVLGNRALPFLFVGYFFGCSAGGVFAAFPPAFPFTFSVC